MNRGAYGATPPSPRSAAPFAPGGYLTLVSGSPVISADQASKTVVYYAQDVHNAVPIIKNGERRAVYFDEPKLTLTSAHATNTYYDVYAVERDGKVHLVTGPAWSTLTAGSSARGTGGGTTELIRTGGMYVNRWGIPGLNAEGAQFIPPLEGTYLGTIFIDGSAGQVTCHAEVGQSRKWGVWNAYNRRLITLQLSDPTASWAFSGNTYQQSNDAEANTVAVFSGLAEEYVDILFNQTVNFTTNATAEAHLSIGVNSLDSAATKVGRSKPSAVAAASDFDITASHVLAPFLGLNNVNSIERGSSATTTSWYGSPHMLLTARWRG